VPAGLRLPAALSHWFGLGILSLGSLLGHEGTALGYTLDIPYLPARKATIIILANGGRGSKTRRRMKMRESMTRRS
jgi:hypothetical protein